MYKYILTVWFKFKYRHISYNEVCCCGEGMESHSAYSNHSPVCEKEWAIESAVDRIIKGGK